MRSLIALAVLVVLASCVGPPAPPPRPAPRPVPVPTSPPPPPAPAPLADDWRDWPVTPGDWVYRQDARGSIALYGQPGADAAFTIRCDRTAGALYLSRRADAAVATPMTIRTTSMLRTLNSLPTQGTPAYLAAALRPQDNLLDAMGFSRGRFIVDQPGMAKLVIPAWAEVLRVTEDCRR